jgi:hypothetical protein
LTKLKATHGSLVKTLQPTSRFLKNSGKDRLSMMMKPKERELSRDRKGKEQVRVTTIEEEALKRRRMKSTRWSPLNYYTQLRSMPSH